MTLKESINRGFNLMATTILALVGFAFSIVAASPVENDWGDRLDDIGLALVGLVALLWYVAGRNRYQRSLVPVVLAGLATAVQMLAVLLERDDPSAFGDNYIGLALLVPFFVVAIIQYIGNGRRLFAKGGDTGKSD